MSTALTDALAWYSEADRLCEAGDYLGLESFLTRIPEPRLLREPELACHLADARSQMGRPAAAVELLERLARQAGRVVSYRIEQAYRSSLGQAHFLLGRLEAAEATWSDFLTAATQEGDHRRLGAAHVNLGVIAEVRSRWTEALTHYERAAAAYQRAGRPPGLGNAHHNRAVCYLELERYDKAESHIEQALTYLRAAGNEAGVLAAEGVRAKIFFRRGDPRLAEAEAQRIVQQARVTGMLWDEGFALQLLGSIRLAEGRTAEAQGFLDAALDRAVRSGIRFFEAEVLEEQMHLAAQLGDREAARAKGDAARTLYHAMGARDRAERILTWLAAHAGPAR